MSRALIHTIAMALGGQVLSLANAANATETWTLDAARSHATFSVRHIVVETVTGRVPITSGSMSSETAGGTPERVAVVLDPRGINTEIDERDDALRGSDYFDVTHYPTWTFSSTSVSTGNPRTMHGNLTIHGRSQPVDLTFQELPPLTNGRHFVATTVVDRHAFGMVRTNADALIGSDVRVDLDAVFVPSTKQ